MMFLRNGPAAVTLSVAFVLCGCSQQAAAPTAAQAQAKTDAATANVNLDTYRQLLRIHNDEMAVTMGKDIVSRFPQSAAATEVQQTLPAIEQRYTQNSEKTRLAALWWYQVAPMAGGKQSTATIRNSQPGTAEPVKLVLRRHTQWGQSAFLYGSGRGFACRRTCTLALSVDGKSVQMKAFAPPTGEPALLFRDDKGFIALVRKAHKIGIDVTMVDGDKKQTLLYEVGGFDPAKWVELGKTKTR